MIETYVVVDVRVGCVRCLELKMVVVGEREVVGHCATLIKHGGPGRLSQFRQ